MRVTDLTESERGVLYALLAHLAEADRRIAPGEILELDDLAEELGLLDLRERVMRARGATRTRDDLLRACTTVEREEARVVIRGLLERLSQADGVRQGEEEELLGEVSRVWSRPAR